MITEEKAKNIVTRNQEETPYSCAILDYCYVFCMKKNGSVYYAVSKKDGTVFPFTPAIDLIAYSKAPKHTY